VVYVNPKESNKILLQGYENVIDTEYLETEKFRKALANRFLRTIERYSKKGSLLDIGCFAGFFLELAKKNRWNTFGIEPSIWAASIAKKKGIKIIGKILTPRIAKKFTFNVITLFDVIEHVDNPKEIIQIAHSLLQKNGVIVIGTPNIDSTFAKIMGKNYPYLIRMHIILFSPPILKKILEENGFKVIHIENYSRTYPLYYILTRLSTLISPLKLLLKLIPLRNPLFQIPIPIYTQDEFIMIAKKI
jgi:2-polyprenyl-3-methyl-5-hydroxy-6-metoxy-1,4-benzoquinol methylase